MACLIACEHAMAFMGGDCVDSSHLWAEHVHLTWDVAPWPWLAPLTIRVDCASRGRTWTPLP